MLESEAKKSRESSAVLCPDSQEEKSGETGLKPEGVP